MIYAGIGARDTPLDIMEIIFAFAASLRAKDVLRTGGAPGADTAFYQGALSKSLPIELFLPWPGFQGHQQALNSDPSEEAMEIARKFHPFFANLKPAARKLQARNSYQILGLDLKTPCNIVVCWTPDGSLDGSSRTSGGTGQALRIAKAHDIEVVNLSIPEHLARIKNSLGLC